jgi:hypothetical protein
MFSLNKQLYKNYNNPTKYIKQSKTENNIENLSRSFSSDKKIKHKVIESVEMMKNTPKQKDVSLVTTPTTLCSMRDKQVSVQGLSIDDQSQTYITK